MQQNHSKNKIQLLTKLSINTTTQKYRELSSLIASLSHQGIQSVMLDPLY